MTKDVKIIKETEQHSNNGTHKVTEIEDQAAQNEHETNVIQRIIWYFFGIIITLLIIRFIFALLGANQNNELAEFIYNVTAPLVSPFSNLFSFNGIQYGVSSFEVFTLVAIAIYTLIGYGIAKLLDIARR